MPEPETDEELVKRVMDTNCSYSMSTLIEKHSPLVVNMIQKYGSGINKKEAYDEVPSIIYESVKTYSPNHNTKFSTWVGTQGRYHAMRERKYRSTHSSKEEPLPLDFALIPDDHDDISESFKDRLDEVKEIHKNLENLEMKEIIQRRFFNETYPNTREIGEAMGISHEWVRVQIARFITLVRNKIHIKNK